jgi:hypothetical protein
MHYIAITISTASQEVIIIGHVNCDVQLLTAYSKKQHSYVKFLALQGCYAAMTGSLFPMCHERLSLPSSRVKKCKNPCYWYDRLSQNVGNYQQCIAYQKGDELTYTAKDNLNHISSSFTLKSGNCMIKA